MKRFTAFLCFCFLLLLAKQTKADDILRIGNPFVENFSKGTYQAGNQNWSITKDSQGVMYFGNANGLLSYDGRYWQSHTMPHRVTVRAVAADGKGKIYCDGFSESLYRCG